MSMAGTAAVTFPPLVPATDPPATDVPEEVTEPPVAETDAPEATEPPAAETDAPEATVAPEATEPPATETDSPATDATTGMEATDSPSDKATDATAPDDSDDSETVVATAPPDEAESEADTTLPQVEGRIEVTLSPLQGKMDGVSAADFEDQTTAFLASSLSGTDTEVVSTKVINQKFTAASGGRRRLRQRMLQSSLGEVKATIQVKGGQAQRNSATFSSQLAAAINGDPAGYVASLKESPSSGPYFSSLETASAQDYSTSPGGDDATEPPAPDSTSTGGLTGGAIAGIVIGVIAGLAIIGGGGYYLYKHPGLLGGDEETRTETVAKPKMYTRKVVAPAGKLKGLSFYPETSMVPS